LKLLFLHLSPPKEPVPVVMCVGGLSLESIEFLLTYFSAAFIQLAVDRPCFYNAHLLGHFVEGGAEQ
jgi:hypothetical protein